MTLLKALLYACVAGWMIIGGALTFVAMMVYGILFVPLNLTPWNFPGDPPVFDLLIFAAGIPAVINVPAWLLLRRFAELRELPAASLPRFSSIVSLTIFGIAAAGILERHDGRWADVRHGIRRYGDAIAAAAGDRHRVLSHEEFEKFKQDFLPTPVPVRLPGYGTVTLRMAHGVYPYVGVDFGTGANALFDPRTMICTYSD